MADPIYLSTSDVWERAAKVHRGLKGLKPSGIISLWPIPRGGVPVAYALANFPDIEIVDHPEAAHYALDDVRESGATAERVLRDHGLETIAFYDKSPAGYDQGAWLVFPWEDNKAPGKDVVTRMLQLIGEDPSRSGILETPKRVIKAWGDMFSGYNYDEAAIKDLLKTFEDGAEKSDEMVLVANIPIYSKCEHHMETIFGVVHIGYVPNGKIVGLSKLKRLADVFAHRLQVQERLTTQIADAIETHLDAKAVGVIIQARHMCMEARGIRTAGSITTTSALRGAIANEPEARAEFLQLIQLSGKTTL